MREPQCSGLTSQEVQERIKNNQTNYFDNNTTKTYKEILKSNIFTLFNFVNVVLALLILITGQFKNMLFITIVMWNIIIGVIQEIRSKKVLDKLAIINAQEYEVVRDNRFTKLNNDDIVLDDILLLKSGQQVPCDGYILKGKIEVNESLITGESDIIIKLPNNKICSGSVVVSGEAYIKATHVGKNSYANKILANVKQHTTGKSEIISSLNKIIKFVSILIIPLGLFLFAKQFFISHVTWQDAIVSTVAALVGMIPDGVMLLTSITLALGAIRLAKSQTLVQELYCIETLARVDTLCCDKTGTVTKGEMDVIDCIEVNCTQANIKNILAHFFNDITDNNSTAQAIRRYVDEEKVYEMWKVDTIFNFSSQRKFSAITYDNIGSFILGAFDFVCDDSMEEIKSCIDFQASQGKRVVVLCHCYDQLDDDVKNINKTILGYLVLTDPVRENAQQTFNYFYEQGVDIKIISGDDVKTVANIAQEAGLMNAHRYIDASELKTKDMVMDAINKYNVFGRVTPEQKKLMIECLQESNHITAMTGDGVNDILALKKADCSIAMGNGADAVKNIANLVLLDSDFSHLPKIVQEGRRVVNNITKTTSLFLIKTVLSIVLSCLTIAVIQQYPFQPIQLSIVSGLAIGMPAYILTLENNKQPIAGNFLKTVLGRALPAGISSVILVFLMLSVNRMHNLNLTDLQLSTISSIILAGNIYFVLYQISVPFTKLRKFVFFFFSILFTIMIIFLPNIKFGASIFAQLNIISIIIVIITLVLIVPLQMLLQKIYNSFIKGNKNE